MHACKNISDGDKPETALMVRLSRWDVFPIYVYLFPVPPQGFGGGERVRQHLKDSLRRKDDQAAGTSIQLK